MDTVSACKKILTFLADAKDNNGMDVVPSEDIATGVGLELGQVRRLIDVLLGQKVITVMVAGRAVRLTQAGYAAARPGLPGTHPQTNSINIGGNVYGSAIAAGGSQATVINNGAVFFAELQKQIETSSIPKEEKEGLLQAVKKLAAHPLVSEAAGALLGQLLK